MTYPLSPGIQVPGFKGVGLPSSGFCRPTYFRSSRISRGADVGLCTWCSCFDASRAPLGNSSPVASFPETPTRRYGQGSPLAWGSSPSLSRVFFLCREGCPEDPCPLPAPSHTALLTSHPWHLLRPQPSPETQAGAAPVSRAGPALTGVRGHVRWRCRWSSARPCTDEVEKPACPSAEPPAPGGLALPHLHVQILLGLEAPRPLFPRSPPASPHLGEAPHPSWPQGRLLPACSVPSEASGEGMGAGSLSLPPHRMLVMTFLSWDTDRFLGTNDLN